MRCTVPLLMCAKPGGISNTSYRLYYTLIRSLENRLRHPCLSASWYERICPCHLWPFFRGDDFNGHLAFLYESY